MMHTVVTNILQVLAVDASVIDVPDVLKGFSGVVVVAGGVIVAGSVVAVGGGVVEGGV